MDLSTTIAGIHLDHPLMNAAGTCKSLEEVKALARTPIAAIMVGSITVEPRPGNRGDTYWSGPAYSLNSMGLPNNGAAYYKQHIPKMVAEAHGVGKPLFMSVAGFSPGEYADLANLASEGGVDLIELNLGCPNVWHKTTQERIACFDPILVAAVLQEIEDMLGVDAKVSVKLSPFSNPFALAEVARVISKSKVVKAVTAVNTFANTLDCQSRITPNNGLAGLAGPAIKPIGLGQVCQLRNLLPARIQIIGVGGISCAQDVLDYQRSGAAAVQIATAYIDRGYKIFNSILSELVKISGV